MKVEKDLVSCACCERSFEKREMQVGLDDEYYCNDCFSLYFAYCEHCGGLHDSDHMEKVVVHPGIIEYWCPDCVDTDATQCAECHRYFSRDISILIVGPHSYCVCSDCYRENDYGRCDGCYSHFCYDDLHFQDGLVYCDECYDVYNIIHDYHSGPRPLLWLGGSGFDREDIAFFGVELELSHGGENNKNAKEIIEAGGHDADKDITVEHDGSLDNGFELISTTASYNYHVNRYEWETMMKKAGSLGYKSHDGGCCGLHVHIDRKYWYSQGFPKSLIPLEKLRGCALNAPEVFSAIILINNAKWLKIFSRRTDFYYCEFPDLEAVKGWYFNPPLRHRDICNKKIMKLLYAVTDREQFSGHNTALNFNNQKTIELRFNRGTLKFNTFVAIMQFSQMFADAVKRCTTPQQACLINFRWFLKTARRRGYTEFIKYLDERSLLK